MDKTALLKKVRALAEHGVGGEAENAEKLLARMMKKYGISEEELDEETRVRHDQMRAAFVRRGDWLNCAGCCQMCKERRTCALACEEVRQMSITDFTKEAKQ